MPSQVKTFSQSRLRGATRIMLITSACFTLGGCWSVSDEFNNFKQRVMDFTSLSTPEQTSSPFINASLPTSGTAGLSRWWEDSQSDHLNGLMDRVILDNLDLKQASYRIAQAGAQLRSARSDFLPTLGAANSGGRSSQYNETSGKTVYSNTYQAKLQSTWQIDLFGRLRNSQIATQAEFEAQMQDRDALAHSLIAGLFDRYVAAYVTREQLKLSNDLVANRQDYLDIIKRRYETGTADISASDVYQATQSLEAARSSRTIYETALTENLNTLDVLLGQMPGTLNADSLDFALSSAGRGAPSCVKGDLLDRRPDLKAQDLRLKAATANVGVAIADLYPDLTLSADYGFSSSSTGSLFDTDRIASSILAQLNARLFEGGHLRAQIDLKKAEAKERMTAYAQAILTAVQDTENAMKADHERRGALKSAHKTLSAQTKDTRLSQKRYERGVVPLSSLLESQAATLNTKISKLSAQQDSWAARTNLYLALGGNWFGENTSCQTSSQKTEG